METIKFEQLNLSEELNKAIKEIGYEEATPIQGRAIPRILEGVDVTGYAQTGTGKTAAFGIPILEKVNIQDKKPQALILCPTRELAIQVSDSIRKLSKYLEGIKILPVYGGQPIERQIKALKGGAQIVIGTPGRVMDHMRRKTLKVGNLDTIILDEADEMLNMGFREDIETILKDTPDSRQTILFSATMSQDILNIAKTYQKNPEMIKVVHKKLTVPNIEQYYIEVKNKNKFETLTRIIDINNPKLAVVFCNTKRKVDELVSDLQGRSYFADGLHGDMKQAQRDRVMNNFRKGTIEILVATDVAARGIDVGDVEMVFNYDVPQDEEYYVHRIGRTGRAGRTGKAYTLVVGKDIYKLKDIQKYTKTKIALERMPSIRDVEEARTGALLEKIKDVIESENLKKDMNIVEKLLEEDYTAFDVAAALLSLWRGKGEQQEQQQLLNEDSFENTGGEPGMARLFINIGKKHKVTPGHIVGAIAGETGLPGELIGSIDIYDKYTFVEVPKKHAKKVIEIMKSNTIKGKSINIEPANKK